MRKNRNRFAINLFFCFPSFLSLYLFHPSFSSRDEEVVHRDNTMEIIDETSSLHTNDGLATGNHSGIFKHTKHGQPTALCVFYITPYSVIEKLRKYSQSKKIRTEKATIGKTLQDIMYTLNPRWNELPGITFKCQQTRSQKSNFRKNFMFDSDPISCYLLRPFCGLFYPVLEANVSWKHYKCK